MEANKDRLEKLEEDGSNIAEARPDRIEDIEARLEELRALWAELEACTSSKEKTLFEAHKAELITQVTWFFFFFFFTALFVVKYLIQVPMPQLDELADNVISPLTF